MVAKNTKVKPPVRISRKRSVTKRKKPITKTNNGNLVLNGIFDKTEIIPDYVEIDGHVFERLENSGVQMELDLEPDTVEFLNRLVPEKGFMNRQEAIRAALREIIKEKGLAA